MVQKYDAFIYKFESKATVQFCNSDFGIQQIDGTEAHAICVYGESKGSVRVFQLPILLNKTLEVEYCKTVNLTIMYVIIIVNF
jgi:hypothetical protein